MALYKKRVIKHGIGNLFDHGLVSITMFITGVLLARSTTQGLERGFILPILPDLYIDKYVPPDAVIIIDRNIPATNNKDGR